MNIFERVSTFCHEKIFSEKEIMNYVVNVRKLDLDNIKKFQIGVFPQDLRELFKVIEPKDLRNSGIIKNASVSVFKNQNLVLPIRDVYGNYIALAGRTLLPEDKRKEIGLVKYMNSVYKKSQHLFGLNFAKKSILKNNKVYIVEGYFDVITPHKNGLENVVATCGVFLSMRHIALLTRYTNNIVVIMDNEPEAQEKAKKIIEKNKYNNIKLSFFNPLEGEKEKDLDEYLKNHSLEELNNKLNKKEEYDIKTLW